MYIYICQFYIHSDSGEVKFIFLISQRYSWRCMELFLSENNSICQQNKDFQEFFFNWNSFPVWFFREFREPSQTL